MNVLSEIAWHSDGQGRCALAFWSELGKEAQLGTENRNVRNLEREKNLLPNLVLGLLNLHSLTGKLETLSTWYASYPSLCINLVTHSKGIIQN